FCARRPPMIMKTLSSTARTALVLSAGILAVGPVQAAQTAYQAQMAKDQQAHPTLAIGSQAPAFDLLGIDGRRHTLDEYRSPILAVVFISNHCPASQLYEGRIKAIARDYQDKGVQVVAIAPNGPDVVGPAALNYTDVDDSFESMKVRAEFRKFNFPYLYDGETQAVAHQYGPKVTPHIFIFDAERKLRYEGRIDDRMQEAKSKVSDARNALDAMLAQKPVAVAHTAVFGCSTKWNEHLESAQAEMKEWNARPVSVETISLDGLRRLRASAPGKTLMINFWATWCAPCQTEYPALLETYLWYRSRDFEFVSVAMQEPAEQAAVLKFLQKQHSAVRNLMLDSDDVYAAMAAFDPAWESGVPYTIVIAPDGKVLLRQQGEVNKLELRRKILGNLPDAGMFAGNTEYWNN
ncbi:MAG TPA: redoxin domain-containing protein, partial [Pyrinomonadaceae bacterium]